MAATRMIRTHRLLATLTVATIATAGLAGTPSVTHAQGWSEYDVTITGALSADGFIFTDTGGLPVTIFDQVTGEVVGLDSSRVGPDRNGLVDWWYLVHARLEVGRVYRLEAGQGSRASGVAYLTADGTPTLDLPITIGSSASNDPGKIPVEYLTGLSNWPAVAELESPETPLAAEAGNARVGTTLLARPGLFWPANTTFTFQWYRGGLKIAGATGTTFTLTAADIGADVKVRVTGHLAPHHPTQWESGNGAYDVLPGTLHTDVPTVSGAPKVGLALSAAPGAWTAGTSFSYQWYVSGTAAAGATGQTFVPRSGHVGHTITVKVAGQLVGYATATSTSHPSEKVAAASKLTVATPTISGTPRVGTKLVVRPGTWTSGTSFSYQWYVGGKAAAGATGATFVPRSGHRGHTITVKVTGRKAGYTTVARLSRASAPVR